MTTCIGFFPRGWNTLHIKNIPHEEPVTQKDPIHQGGPPAWFSEYFGKLDQSLKEIKQQQAKIIHNQNRQQEHLGRLESAFYGIQDDVERLKNLYVEQGSKIDKIGNNCETMQATHGEYAHTFSEIQDQLAGIWHTIDPPLHIPFNPQNVPPPSQPYYRYPPYW